MSQAQIAGAIGLAPQYLSDILHGRRPLTELVARRIGEKFHVDYRALVGLDSWSQRGLVAGVAPGEHWLPVFSHPIEGEPTLQRRWRGVYAQVPAVAAAKLAAAVQPYVLRFGHDDVEGRLHKNDLVLISQSQNQNANIAVIRTGKKCYLCRRQGRSWVRLANGDVLSGDCVVVGHCLGVLWSAL